MANAMYGKGKEHILNGDIDFDTNVLKAILLSSSYTPSLSTHEFLTDVSSYRLNTDQTLTGVTKTLGVFDANDPTWTAVASGSTASYVAIYKDTGTPSTSLLIALFDTITNFPVSTIGSDITVRWDNGASKIIAL